MALGASVKLTAGLFLPFAIAAGGGLGARNRRREVAIGAALLSVLIAAMGFAAFGSGPLHLPGTLAKTQSEGDWHSIPGFISTRLGMHTLGHVTGLALGVVFFVLFAWLVLKVWRGQLDWIDGAGWTAVALVVTASALLPWYVAWALPFAALCSDRRLWSTAIVLTGVVQGIELLGYIPHGI
jgi:hypothetical protein